MTETRIAQAGYQFNLWSWLTTVDHKQIGILYGLSAAFFLLIGGSEALLIRTQLIVPNNNFLAADTFNSMFTMHGVTMIFLVIMPVNAAFFNYLVPLQIGARDVAFPRLNAFSYWVFLFGGLFFHLGFFAGDLPKVGWFGYANLTSAQYTPGQGTDFWTIGLQLLGFASLVSSINFIATILNMRAPGMTPMRMPIFTWTILITNFLLLLALPVITVALAQVFFDRQFGTKFFDPSSGGSVLLWQHLFWVFGHPEVYILILPAMGIVSEVLATSSRKPVFGYTAMVFATAALGLLGFSVWAHHMFTVGMGAWANVIFSAATMLIAIPTGVKIFNWIFTMVGGQVRFTAATYYAVAFIVTFMIGGLSGVMHASPPIDSQHQDSYFVVAHFHYVLFGGSIMGILSGLHYWFPKMSGKMLDDRFGKIVFWLIFVGFNMTFFPMHFLGVDGMPRRIYTYPEGFGFELWNFVCTIGAYITLVGMLGLAYNMVHSAIKGETALADPWDGRTLEWAIPSTPMPHNFGKVPKVRARDDFWHSKYVTKDFKPDPTNVKVVLPNPSYWPILCSLGLFLFGFGFLFAIPVTFVGAIITFVSVVGWSFEPAEG